MSFIDDIFLIKDRLHAVKYI